MRFAELSRLSHRVAVGVPLPFNVRDANQTLLLARGHKLETSEHLEALFRRGALVDLQEVLSPEDEVRHAARHELPALWSRCLGQVSKALLQAPDAGFRRTLDDAALPVQALVERDADLAIFQVLRQGGDADVAYGARRSMQTAITALLVAQRLGWGAAQCERLFKAALTMNISMLGLQGELARQTTPLSAAQRADLQLHPMRSVRMLQLAGIDDAGWLDTVLHHHEQEDGSGYPGGHTHVSDLATLARRADVYTSKLASRSMRSSMTADLAGRQMFMQDPGHPMTAALVREFGIYPPGSYVRLSSGELAIVVQRGPSITAPIVACLTNGRGQPLATPERRGTDTPAHAVAACVGERSVDVRMSLDRLAALVTA